MRTRFVLSLPTLLVPLFSTALPLRDSTAQVDVRAALTQLPSPDATVRIELADRTRLQGKVTVRSDSILILRNRIGTTLHGTAYDTLRVRLDSIVRVWLADGRRTGRGALTGALVGAALGLGMAYVWDKEEIADADCVAKCYVGFVATFTVAGTGAGALIGSLFTRWTEIERAPTQR
jgi:hypothetical protein